MNRGLAAGRGQDARNPRARPVVLVAHQVVGADRTRLTLASRDMVAFFARLRPLEEP
jgi:hypothetical protein